MDTAFHAHVNSKIIEERHRSLYERLYRTCPTVVSAPATFPWSPTYAVGPGGVGLCSKLPLRMHLGVEPRPSGGLSWGDLSFYLPERDEFRTLEQSRVSSLILDLLVAVAHRHGKPAHARLWGLAEIPFFRGLNADPLCGVTIAIAWLLHIGVITPNDVEQFTVAPTETLTSLRPFMEVWRLALQVESAIAAWVTNGDLTMATIIDAAYPVAFFREQDPILFDHYRDLGIDDPSSYYNVAGNLFFRAVRMDELYQLDSFPYWPIDVALVHCGEEGSSTTVYKTRGAFAARLDEAAAFTRTHLVPLAPDSFRRPPKFTEFTQETLQQPAGMAMLRTYRDDAVVHSMVVLKATYDLLQYGTTPHILREFIQAQNICQDLLRLVGLSPFAMSAPRRLFRLLGHTRTEAGVASRLVGPGNHGCLMVLGAQNALADILEEALPRIREETGKSIHCHYASWCDGMPVSEGARVHQHLASGLRSAYVNGGTVSIRVYERGSSAGVLLCSPEQWAEERATYDIAFEPRENRIYVRGKPLTSNDLHTTKQTMEIFRTLLASGKREYAADELPASSYRDDRNQMESKVIRPFKAAVERYTEQQFDLRVTGGLGRNYTLIHAPNGQRIAWAEW